MNCESVAPSHAKTIGTNFALKSFHAIINLVSELWDTKEFPLRILYFTPNFTDMLFISVPCEIFNFLKPISLAIIYMSYFWFAYNTTHDIITCAPRIDFKKKSERNSNFRKQYFLNRSSRHDNQSITYLRGQLFTLQSSPIDFNQTFFPHPTKY